jgi:hypothetical protein
MPYDDESEPAELRHCRQVYAAMVKTAKERNGGEGPMLVWEGFSTRLVAELGLAVPYYTKVYRNLKAMGCVKQLQRGGSSTPSQWWLIGEPTQELWDARRAHTSSTKLEVLTQRVSNLEKRLSEYDRMFREGIELPPKITMTIPSESKDNA